MSDAKNQRLELIRGIRPSMAQALCSRIEELSLTQIQAAELLVTGQSAISRIVNNRLSTSKTKNEISAWQILGFLISLGANVEISISSYSSPGKGKVSFKNA